jgi:hypothetical protein
MADIGAFEADFISSAPAIVSHPHGGTFRAGTNVTLAVGVSGTAPLSYRWFKDNSALSGATHSSLSLSNVQAADAGSFSVPVTNADGTATSQVAVLVVDSIPLLMGQPMSVTISPGATAQFAVSADGPSLA